jgi:hypothetical protein
MKYLFLFTLLISTQTFAAIDFCTFEETSDFKDALEKRRIRPFKKSTDHKRFLAVEKKLIQRTITDNHERMSERDALQEFGDFYRGKQGGNAGEVVYYNYDGKRFVMVHYWPGDNEVGAYFQVEKNGNFKKIATIGDSFISCR